MKDDVLQRIEKDLIRILNEEYSFYQSLYIMLDKQRDIVKYNKDECLLDSFAEIERCHMRIRESEQKLTEIRNGYPSQFRSASSNPEVKKLTNCISTLVKKNIDLVNENEAYVKDRRDRLQQELENLKNSGRILQHLRQYEPSPQFVDSKE